MLNKRNELLYEKSAGAVIYKINKGNPLFLVTYSNNDYPGFPKGHIEKGETEEIAAIREIKEEVGLNVTLKPNFRTSISYIIFDTSIQKEVVFFLAEIEENETINIDLNEINKYEIVDFEQAKSILNDYLMQVLTKSKEYIESISNY